jgi:hypothetical protein
VPETERDSGFPPRPSSDGYAAWPPPLPDEAPSAAPPGLTRPTADPSGNPLLNTKSAAIVLGVTTGALNTWRHRGIGPPYVRPSPNAKGRSKRSPRYRLSDLHAWLAARAAQPPRALPGHYRATSRVDRTPRRASTPQGLDRTEGAPQALEALWRAIQPVGSIVEWCRQNDLNDQVVKQVLEGTKVMPPNVAAAIGYRALRIVRYVKLDR